MACLDTIPSGNVDSEMEEGEIVDEIDDLSDISSEEEFLLRQRLQVLENYNNVLERKKAKNSFSGSGNRLTDSLLNDLSEVSATELDDSFIKFKPKPKLIIHKEVSKNRTEVKKPVRSHYKSKKRKVDLFNVSKAKDIRKKPHHKKKPEIKIISESSDETEDEYRNKRRKLADAVAVNRKNNDKSSLQDRLQRMLCGTKFQNSQTCTKDKQTETEIAPKVEDASCSPIVVQNIDFDLDKDKPQVITPIVTIEDNIESVDIVDSITKEVNEVVTPVERDSDEDLELLRQHALKTKSVKQKTAPSALPAETEKPISLSEDEDSDTAELRLICLKSALLKKAIEMKQKQKLRKRLSQSSNMNDDLLTEKDELLNNLEIENNTDIESVDMEIGSDVDEKGKELISEHFGDETQKQDDNKTSETLFNNVVKTDLRREEEIEEDEDLLRAKLLTSLSKNLPKLVDPNIIKSIEEEKPKLEVTPANTTPKAVASEKRIIINLGESDSEGEHEATKNLTKMHMKLSEQIDFQQKLDLFLKSTRMEVEKQKLPDVVQKTATKPEKFVAKTVNHLPKSEQIEYKNLVKRMAELQKMKEVRQISLNKVQVKDTLKPRNVTVTDTVTIENIEEQIALSRKKIAEESSRMLKLKEEGTKLSQKYKIVATELKNISTAITLNKKEQRAVQNKLSKIRSQHQRLLNSSTSKHSKPNNLVVNRASSKVISNMKHQKENNPKKEEYKNLQSLKAVKVSVVNNMMSEDAVSSSRLSIQVDLNSNKKIVTMPNERTVDVSTKEAKDEKSALNVASLPVIDKGGGKESGGNVDTHTVVADSRIERRKKDANDYESPLQALDSANWQADPNAILCPFEIGGSCRDADCKYLHPKIPSQ